jgi:hypothetical protein
MNIFFHPLVLHPRRAFTDDQLGLGFQEYFVTAREFGRILQGLWQKGWTLVDAHQAATGRDLSWPMAARCSPRSDGEIRG